MAASGAMVAAKTVVRHTAKLAAATTSAARMLPGFLIVGGKRCGSTSLYEYLIRHPAVLPCHAPKGTHYFDVNFTKGWRWYRAQFPLPVPARVVRRGNVVTGEASPYYMFHPLAPDRIARALPEVRLIAVLRDPVDRAYSHYQYSRRRGFESLPIEEAFDREPDRLAGELERLRSDPGYQSYSHRHHTYLTRGHYAEQLDVLYRLFPRSHVLVLQSEGLFADPDRALGQVFAFLGLEQHLVDGVTAYKAGTYEAMPPAVRERLTSYYREHNERLYALPGIDFRWDPVATTARPARG